MKKVWSDLVDNPTGKSSAKGSLKTAMASDERLRAFRRGIMLKFVGNMQSLCIYQLRRISADIEQISDSNLMEFLPYNTEDIELRYVFYTVYNLIAPNGVTR